MTDEKRKPVHSIRVGNVEAAIWVNKSQNGSFHSVTFSRKYRTEEGTRNADSYSNNDLLVLAKAADFAHTWTQENRIFNEEEAA
jgi:hypothetical protein